MKFWEFSDDDSDVATYYRPAGDWVVRVKPKNDGSGEFVCWEPSQRNKMHHVHEVTCSVVTEEYFRNDNRGYVPERRDDEDDDEDIMVRPPRHTDQG